MCEGKVCETAEAMSWSPYQSTSFHAVRFCHFRRFSFLLPVGGFHKFLLLENAKLIRRYEPIGFILSAILRQRRVR